MARLFTSGFELNTVTTGVEWSLVSGAGVTIDTGTVRTGTYAMKCTTAAATRQGMVQQFETAANTGPLYLRFYLNISVASNGDNCIAVMAQGATISSTISIDLNIQSNNALRLRYVNGSSVFTDVGTSSALNTGQWYRVEMKFNNTGGAGAGIAEASIDGTVFATASNLTFLGNVAAFRIGTNHENSAVSAGTYFFDDVAVNDGTGSNQTSYPGSGKVIALKPNAAGDINTYGSTSGSQTGGTAGAANNFTRVQEVTPDDLTSFNGSTTLNEADMFNVDNSGIGANDIVNVVEVHGRHRNDTADAAQTVKYQIEKAPAGTITQSAAIIPNLITWTTDSSATNKPAPIVLYKDPDAVNAWTQATLDSMQIGYKLTVDGTGTRQIQVTKVWALVDYTPSTLGPSTDISMWGPTQNPVPNHYRKAIIQEY